MNKKNVGVATDHAVGHLADIATEAALHGMISAGLSRQAEGIDAKMQACLRRGRVRAVSGDQDASWSARFWSAISVPAVMRMPIAQASVAMLVAVFSISLVLTPGTPIVNPIVSSAVNPTVSSVISTATGDTSDIKNVDAKSQQNGAQSLSEMDVLMSNEDMEFLENLEIYEWLAAEYG